MKGVNVTVRLDEDVKKDFDMFCENVGITVTTAFNMFIRATLRTRQLPFVVTDIKATQPQYSPVVERGLKALAQSQARARANGTSEMTLDEINELISESRLENANARGSN